MAGEFASVKCVWRHSQVVVYERRIGGRLRGGVSGDARLPEEQGACAQLVTVPQVVWEGVLNLEVGFWGINSVRYGRYVGAVWICGVCTR